MAQGYTKGSPIDSDPTLSSNTDLVSPSQAAVVTYVANQIATTAVTNVTATAPVVSTGGNTPDISMPLASTIADGYLSATNFNTFNNKVSSVTALVPLSSSGGVNPILGITLATVSTSGYLSFTDWNTFNSKEPALTKGNLTESISSVLTITGGSNAVIGTGTSIQVLQATTSQSGFLRNTDWNTFNNKQNAITLTTTGTSGPATLNTLTSTLNIPQYAGGGGVTTNDAIAYAIALG